MVGGEEKIERWRRSKGRSGVNRKIMKKKKRRSSTRVGDVK